MSMQSDMRETIARFLLRYAPLPMFVQGSHMFAMFYVHVHMHYVKNVEYPSHSTWTMFTHFAQNCTIVSVLALYGSTMHIAIV